MRRPVSSPARGLVLLATALGLALAPAAVTDAGAAVGSTGSLVFWNRFERQTDPLRSEVGPDVQLTSYRVSSWEQAKTLPGRFGNGLFVNQGTDEGWNDDGANFFAADLDQTSLTPQAGVVELWFTFRYDSSEYNHAYFFDSRSTFAGHFTKSESEMHSGALLAAGWNGWDYGSYGKRFFFAVGTDPVAILWTPDYSAAPGGRYDFQPGDQMHFGFVWDLDGIAGSQDTMRIYIDGQLAAAGQGRWSNPAFDRFLYIGGAPNTDPWDTHYNAVVGVTDNLKMYDAARTDFSDRNQEMPWTLRGFKPPVRMPPATTVVKAGATVPLKFEILARTHEITDPAAVSSFTAARLSCATGAVLSRSPITRAGGTRLRYDWTAGQFVENWKTPARQAACYRVTMTTQVGASLSARFLLR
jgi:hypothetical protein